jgi:beta-glucosidase-like glycosyl hydrolase
VRALQGTTVQSENPTIDSSHVIATGKHFAGHGSPKAARTSRLSTSPNGFCAKRICNHLKRQ